MALIICNCLRSTIVATSLLVTGVLFVEPVGAAVNQIEILSRTPVAGGKKFGKTGSYELITGRLRFAIDPENPANKNIVDLKYAPRDAKGRVNLTSDFILLTPADTARANGNLIYGVNNRGNLIMLNIFNDANWSNTPVSEAELGNGFLLNQGYTLLWSAWNWDVLPGNGRLQIDIPTAKEGDKTITGPVATEMVTTYPQEILALAWGGSRGYPPLSLDNPDDRLSVRIRPENPRQLIPRKHWRFVSGPGGSPAIPVGIELEGDFKPDRLYEAVYQAKDPRVVGLGLAAIRDTISFFRFESHDEKGKPNPLAKNSGAEKPGIYKAIIYGFSQSARVIQHMLLQGFHFDEFGRPVFDAGFVHGPGGGKGSFNHRFAQTTRHPSHFEDLSYPADFFPFSTSPTHDPVSGKKAGLLDLAREKGFVPKLLYLSSSTEYWTRSASLLHTDVEGKSDIHTGNNVRLYTITGSPHSVGVRTSRGPFRACHNPLDFRPLARALLVALHDWVNADNPPPPSVFPKLAEKTLGSVIDYRRHFPEIANLMLPESNLKPPRLDHGPRFNTEGIADLQPPVKGVPFVTLVPLPDKDGLDRGGIRLPEVVAPLGTYLGWNLRQSSLHQTRLGRWEGSFIPFALDKKQRMLNKDPRPSILERFPSKSQLLAKLSLASIDLVKRRFLLEDDIPRILERASSTYDAMLAKKSDRTCEYLAAWQVN